MNIIQVSRGKFSVRFKKHEGAIIKPLSSGELFEVVIAETSDVIAPMGIYDAGRDPDGNDPSSLIKETYVGDVFIGLGDGKISKIGAANTIHSGRPLPAHVGEIIDISSNTFDKTPGTFYVYEASDNVTLRWGHPNKEIKLRQGDMVYFSGYEIVDDNSYPVAWCINNTGAEANITGFNSNIWNFPTLDNVHNALVWLDGHKAQYGERGPLTTELNPDDNSVIVKVNGKLIKPGNIYQITENIADEHLQRIQNRFDTDSGSPVTIKKYDFLYVEYKSNDTDNGIPVLDATLNNYGLENYKLKVFHGGASDAEDILYIIDTNKEYRGDLIASEAHKSDDGKIHTIKEAFDSLYRTKADLVSGKIITSQLPDTVLGALQFKGSISKANVSLDALPDKGDYFIYTGVDTPLSGSSTLSIENVETGDIYEVNIEYNIESTNKLRKGDWIVFTDVSNGIVKKVDLIDHSEGYTFFATTNTDGETTTNDKSTTLKGSSREIKHSFHGTDLTKTNVINLRNEDNNGTGTVVLDTENIIISGEDLENYIPVGVGNKGLVKSPIKVDKGNEGNADIVNITTSDLRGKNTTIKFENGEEGESYNLTMPAHNGTVISDQSIIDCGEWV